MKRFLSLALVVAALAFTAGCKRDHYKVHFKVLRQNTQPAEGFRVDMSVKGKSEAVTTEKTNGAGMAEFKSLPAPDSTHQLVGVLHYYMKGEDQARTITYPFIPSDAERLNDTQYIPNNATPEAQ